MSMHAMLKHRVTLSLLILALPFLNAGSMLAQQNTSPDAASNKPVAIASDLPNVIERVTLYRDQALVTRSIEVPAGGDVREIAVGNLPEQVVVESIYAEGSEQIDVRGVRVTQKAVFASDSEEVAEIQAAMKDLALERESVSIELKVVDRQIDYIDKLMDFSADASHADRSQGLLDATALVELTNYSMERQASLNAERSRLQQSLLELEDQATQLLNRSRLLTQPTGTQYGVRLLVANSDAGQGGTVELSYLVSGCRWSPQYTIRGVVEGTEFSLRYNALVEQMSGEDWSNVKLTLSTASPSMGASGPSLTPFRVAVRGTNVTDDLFGGPSAMQLNGNQQALQEMSKGLKVRQQQVANEYAGKHSQVDNLTRDYALNAVASEVQNLELGADAKQLRTLADDASDEVASQIYEIDQVVSLDSRREQQLVSIIDTQLSGELYHVATPLLSSFAYREADLINDQGVGLLRGPATIYLDGRFVGRTEIPSIASGQHLVVGFGADNQVRTRRELLDKVDEVQGGNRRLTFEYRLVVANFKSDAVQLRLYDRLPLATQTAEISVTPLAFQVPISEDGLYARIQKPRGILRWDLEVPAENYGEKAFDVDYGYTVEFDRSGSLTAIIDETQIAADYQEIGMPGGGMGGGMGGMGTPN